MKIRLRHAVKAETLTGEKPSADPAGKSGRFPRESQTLYIRDGKWSEPFEGPYEQDIDLRGRIVFPGLIDAHVHLRDPGQTYKEDIETGTAAAAAGGFTSLACMPNTNPICDDATVVRYILDKAARVGHVRVWPVGAVTKGSQGLELAEIGQMKEAGVVALSDDGRPVASASMLMKAMRYASDFGLTILDHCEDQSLCDGVMNEGLASEEMGLPGIPSVAESICVARDLLLAEYLKLPIHICHVSTESSVALIRAAKARGVQVTAETCPQYIYFTDDDCRGYNSLCKCNPPLQRPKDQAALIEALRDGTLDMLATDHAPHHEDEKDCVFPLAKNGMLGLETALSIAYEVLVQKNGLCFADLQRFFCSAPARLLKLDLGSFDPGRAADLCVFDPSETWICDRFKLASKAHNSPYHGRCLQGRVKLTLLGGKVVYDGLS